MIGSADSSANGLFAMNPSMQTTFFSSLAAFSILFIALYWHRYRLGNLQAEINERRAALQEEGE
jgi:cbb3-type cytochrome oxidase subunit 3